MSLKRGGITKSYFRLDWNEFTSSGWLGGGTLLTKPERNLKDSLACAVQTNQCRQVQSAYLIVQTCINCENILHKFLLWENFFVKNWSKIGKWSIQHVNPTEKTAVVAEEAAVFFFNQDDMECWRNINFNKRVHFVKCACNFNL